MTGELYPIPGPWPGRLVIVPRPRGGDWLADEIAAWRMAGVDVVVSLLTPEEDAEFDITGERAACLAAGVDFVPFPIPDRGVPADRASAALGGSAGGSSSTSARTASRNGGVPRAAKSNSSASPAKRPANRAVF